MIDFVLHTFAQGSIVDMEVCGRRVSIQLWEWFLGEHYQMCVFLKDVCQSKWVMEWTEKGYDMVWDKRPPVARELKHSKSSFDNQEFVTKVISDMMEAGAASVLPTGVRSIVEIMCARIVANVQEMAFRSVH